MSEEHKKSAHSGSSEQQSDEPPIKLRGRRVKSFDTITEDEWQKRAARGRGRDWFIEAEKWMKFLIEQKELNEGNLYGTGFREAAAKELRVNVRTIDRKLERYESNPHIDSLLEDDSGPTKHTTLDAEHQKFILHILLNPGKELQLKYGNLRVKSAPGPSFILHRAFPLQFPDAKVSIDKRLMSNQRAIVLE